MTRIPLVSLLATLLSLSGCYDSYGLGGGPSRDSGRPDSSFRDGDLDAPSFDGGLDSSFDAPFDAVPDAVPDAIPDAIVDSGVDTGPLVEPPLEPPPDPTSCRIEPTIHPFDDPVLEYRWPTVPVVQSAAVHVSATPLVIDMDPVPGEELEPDLVFVSYAPLRGRFPEPGVLRIVDPRTNETLSFPALEEESGLLEATTNLAAGDIDGDGNNEVVGLGTFAGTFAFDHNGELLWEANVPSVVERGSRRGRSISGGPNIADLDGDGRVEVIAGHNVIDGTTGAVIWSGAEETGRAVNEFFGPLDCIADLDGDGFQEVIAGNTVFHHDGTIYWEPEDVNDGLCAVADMYPDNPGPEVILVSSGFVRILDGQNGDMLWLRRIEGRGTRSLGGPPTVADFDGDGEPEIGIAHGAAYGVYDPGCTGVGAPAGCTAEGLLWRSPTSDASSSGTGSSVFDFNGDGRAEVIYNDEHFFRVYDGLDGDVLFQHRNSSRTRTENPTIADIDNDGDAEIIFSANAEARFIMDYWTDPGVEVWGDARGRWVGARRIWNQHAYDITSVEEDGSIPAHPEPSWEAHNSFRQNLREGDDVLVVPDLWGGRGSYECTGARTAILRVTVSNYGLEVAGAGVVIGFYRGDADRGGVRIAEAMTTRTLSPRGDSEVVEVEVTLGAEVENWYAYLDDPEEPVDGAVFECREGNNEVLFWQPECP